MIDFFKAKNNFLKAIENFNNEKWNDFFNNPLFLWAPTLNNSHLKNCRLIESRIKMLEYLPKGGVVCEVGTQYGKFAEKILSITSPQKFHIIDLNLSWFKQELKNNPDKQLLSEKIADNTVELHQGDSSTILATFPDHYFDWIYIDGDHSYKGVKNDIEQGYHKVKENGLLVFDDYTIWSICELIPYGIPRAVNEFCLEHNWELIFFALRSLGYHNVAIRKINSKE